MQHTHEQVLSPKKHFEILDGLRGVAAIVVVIFHFMEEIIKPDGTLLGYNEFLVGHGFLAVDFFFCLSGFVIAYAYDDRIAKIGVWQFLKSRLIRLHPLVVMGVIVGLLGLLFDPFAALPQGYGAGKILLIFASSVLLVPYAAMSERFFNIFPLNAPMWSLFWEYVANIFYVLVLVKINRQVLAFLTLLSAIAIFVVIYRAHSIAGGWGKDNFWDGCARISFSFLAGMMVYRFQWIINNKLGFLGMSALLMLAFIFPYHEAWNRYTETFIVVIYFPFLVALGAGAQMHKRVQKICTFSGNISYPLYMMHFWAIWIFVSYIKSHTVSSLQMTLIISIGTLLLMAFAYITMKFYDTPIRKWLHKW